MSIEIFHRDKDETLNRVLTICLYRLVGGLLFLAGLYYWIRLVGIYDDPLWRFDLMPLWWRVAAPVLAVLYPVAGVGLWMTASWGVVIWVLAATVEVIMHVGFPQLFGGDIRFVVAHLIGFAFLAALRLIAFFEARHRRRQAH